MKPKQPLNIYQNKRGITFLDGYYLARNPRTHLISVISITKGIVYIHDVTRQMNLQDLVNLDSTGYLDIYEELEQRLSRQKNKHKKQSE